VNQYRYGFSRATQALDPLGLSCGSITIHIKSTVTEEKMLAHPGGKFGKFACMTAMIVTKKKLEKDVTFTIPVPCLFCECDMSHPTTTVHPFTMTIPLRFNHDVNPKIPKGCEFLLKVLVEITITTVLGDCS